MGWRGGPAPARAPGAARAAGPARLGVGGRAAGWRWSSCRSWRPPTTSRSAWPCWPTWRWPRRGRSSPGPRAISRWRRRRSTASAPTSRRSSAPGSRGRCRSWPAPRPARCSRCRSGCSPCACAARTSPSSRSASASWSATRSSGTSRTSPARSAACSCCRSSGGRSTGACWPSRWRAVACARSSCVARAGAWRWLAIGGDEERAEVLGVRPIGVKVAVFALSAALMGATGAAIAPRWTYIDPHIAFNPLISFQVIIMALLGGVSRPAGPVVGALVLGLLSEIFLLQFRYRLHDRPRRRADPRRARPAPRHHGLAGGGAHRGARPTPALGPRATDSPEVCDAATASALHQRRVAGRARAAARSPTSTRPPARPSRGSPRPTPRRRGGRWRRPSARAPSGASCSRRCAPASCSRPRRSGSAAARICKRMLTTETGAVRAKAGFEVGYCTELIRQAASLTYQASGEVAPSNVSGKINYFMRKPVGVVSVISPWNFPYILTLRAVAPALALGNAVVLKPSEETPLAGGLLVAEVFEEAGVPPGVLNVITCAREEVAGGGRRDGHASGRRRRQLHRLHRHRPRAGREGRPPPQAHRAGARRQEPDHRAGGRRPRPGGERRRLRRLLPPGPDLHGGHADPRGALAGRRARLPARGEARHAQDGRPERSADRDRAHHEPDPAREDPGARGRRGGQGRQGAHRRPQPRPVLRADAADGRDARDALLLRGDVRAGGRAHAGEERRRGRAPRQRHQPTGCRRRSSPAIPSAAWRWPSGSSRASCT